MSTRRRPFTLEEHEQLGTWLWEAEASALFAWQQAVIAFPRAVLQPLERLWTSGGPLHLLRVPCEDALERLLGWNTFHGRVGDIYRQDVTPAFALEGRSRPLVETLWPRPARARRTRRPLLLEEHLRLGEAFFLLDRWTTRVLLLAQEGLTLRSLAPFARFFGVSGPLERLRSWLDSRLFEEARHWPARPAMKLTRVYYGVWRRIVNTPHHPLYGLAREDPGLLAHADEADADRARHA